MGIFGRLARRALPDVGARNDADRQAWVAAQLGALAPGLRLLDAGAGEQRYRPLCAHLEYVSQDFCEYTGTGDGSALQTGKWDTRSIDLVSDIARIPVPDASFDAILCTEVLEHVPEPVAALREFSRILKPGGRLILTAPFCSLTHMAPHHYYSGFNRYFFTHHLGTLGFAEVETLPNGDYAEYLGQELRRIPGLYGNVPLLPRLAIGILLRFLGAARRSGVRTDDLLCFGYHIRAVRKP